MRRLRSLPSWSPRRGRRRRQVGQAGAADALGGADGAQDRIGEHLGAERADQRRRRAPAARAGREGEDDIAVAHRVDRVDAAREAVVRHLRDLARLGLGQHRVGRDDPDRRRRAGGAARLEPRRHLAAPERAHRADELPAVGGARAGDDAAGARIDDVADRVDGDERGDRDAADLDRRRADAALHRPADAEQLADRRAGAGADVALGERVAATPLRRPRSRRRHRAGSRIADPEIEQDRRRHDRHDERRRTPSAGAPIVAPMPRSSSQRITPLAASRPKALPPASTIACTLSIALTGRAARSRASRATRRARRRRRRRRRGRSRPCSRSAGAGR